MLVLIKKKMVPKTLSLKSGDLLCKIAFTLLYVTNFGFNETNLEYNMTFSILFSHLQPTGDKETQSS